MKVKRHLFDLDESGSREFDFSILLSCYVSHLETISKGMGSQSI